MFQGDLSHLQPGSAPVPPPQPQPEPAAVPARQGLQEHGPGYGSEPAAHWWGHFTSSEHGTARHGTERHSMAQRLHAHAASRPTDARLLQQRRLHTLNALSHAHATAYKVALTRSRVNLFSWSFA